MARARFNKKIVGNSQKSSAVRQNILSSLVREGADLGVIEDKAEQLLDHTRLNKLRNNKTRPSKFTKLIELKQKYEKKDQLLIYSLNSRSMNSKPTHVFSNSETAIEIGRQIGIKTIILARHMPTLMEMKKESQR